MITAKEIYQMWTGCNDTCLSCNCENCIYINAMDDYADQFKKVNFIKKTNCYLETENGLEGLCTYCGTIHKREFKP